MKVMRKVYDMLMYGAYVHAKWEYDSSMSILKNKKKLLFLLILRVVLLCMGTVLVYAKDALILGGKKAYAPPIGFAAALSSWRYSWVLPQD